MKRLVVLAGIGLVIGLLIVAASSRKPDPFAPKFVPGTALPSGAFPTIHYDWAGAVPFAGGKVWIWAMASPTNRHCFLYDLESRQVVGELFNAGPVFCNRDQTKLLCYGPDALITSVKQKVSAFIKTGFLGKLLLPKVNRPETFWVLDLRDNSVRRGGELSQIPGTGSSWRPSPGFRYGCNVPNNAEEGSAFFLCDLETAIFEKIRVRGDLQGWWDDSQILFRDPANNFILFDVVTRKTNMLFSADALANSLRQMDITNSPGIIRAINVWNGRDYDFYLALQKESYGAGESFLLKTSHKDPAPRLLYPKFKFEHLGRLDASATHYLYNGESGSPGRGGDGAVLLRDLSNDTVQTLVPPDGGRQYALARFYRDEIIYFRNRLPWRMQLNGSNNVPLFPVTARMPDKN
jgi:hypothetical protein